MRFHLDEDQSDIVAGILRDRFNLDVTSSHELGMNHATDIEQLAFAAGQTRCLVTRNGKDFVRLTRQHQREILPHAGAFIVPNSMFGRSFWGIARAIAYYAHLHPDESIPYLLDYLHPAPNEWMPG